MLILQQNQSCHCVLVKVFVFFFLRRIGQTWTNVASDLLKYCYLMMLVYPYSGILHISIFRKIKRSKEQNLALSANIQHSQ